MGLGSPGITENEKKRCFSKCLFSFFIVFCNMVGKLRFSPFYLVFRFLSPLAFSRRMYIRLREAIEDFSSGSLRPSVAIAFCAMGLGSPGMTENEKRGVL